jgi:Gpi18-like mannosyltransferase
MKKIAFYLIANRVVLIIILFFISKIKPFSNFIQTFAHRWDGNSYTFIASHGYVTSGPEKNFIVFPPLYPIAIKLVAWTGIDPTIAGFLISNVFFILGMLILYKLIESDWSKKTAVLTIFLLSIFPTTHFFSVAYPESLFVLLFALSFYCATKNKFYLAALTGGLAAITRPFGLIIFPSIILFMLKKRELNFKNLIISGLVFSVPVAYYLYLNYSIYGSPLAFTELLRKNWQKGFDFPWKGIISSWKRGILTKNSFSYKYIVGYAEAIASTIAWVLTVTGIKKWGIKSPYLLYMFLGTIFFTSTGFILSAPRYLLSIPPLFILFAELISNKKYLLFFWVPVSLALLFWFGHDFAVGRWAF